MSILKENPHISIKDLGSRLICESGSPSRLVETMVREKMIEKVQNIKDSRSVNLKLTPHGNHIIEQVKEQEKKLYEIIALSLDAKRLSYLNLALRDFLKDSSVEEALVKRGFI